MTYNRLGLFGWSLTCAVGLFAAVGCGDDASEVSLELVAPTPDQVLTLKDDTDDTRADLQFGVVGQATGIKLGTSINLSIDDEPRAEAVDVGDGGVIDFGDVTLPPGEHSISIGTANGSVSSDKQQQYTFKALLIRSPADNARLSSKNDDDMVKPGVQISPTVKAFAIGDGEVELVVDGTATKPEKPSSDGMVVFGPLDLSNGHHRMVARSGTGKDRITSPEIEVDVEEGECGSVMFSMPTLPKAGEDLHLGGAGNCPSGSDAFTATFELSTDASDGSSVELFVNDRSAGTEKVASGKVSFKNVALTRRGDVANKVEVEVAGSEGASCRVEYPAKVFVDCEGPTCGITSPTPVAYDDGSDTTLYLNAGMQHAGGFDVEVESDSSVVGRDVELVIDGDTQGALSASAAAEGAGSLALFDAVDLAEGEHTVEGFCTDAAGNRVSTGAQTWVVDTTACGLDLTDPRDGAVIVPGDDLDLASPGTQVIASSDVTGDDCVMQRAAVCDPADGITGVELVAYDGSTPLLSPIRLDDAATDQDLCVEVQDRAGNSTLDSVTVQFQTGELEPAVTLTAPEDGDDFGPRADVGESCDAGDEYGVLVTGTIAMGGDSEVDVLVNGTVVADNVDVTGTAVSVCVAVPDDADNGNAASTITLRATSTTSDAEDEVSVDVHVHSVRITDPLDAADLLIGDDCDAGAGYGYEVHVDFDVSLDDASYTIAGGGATLTGNVDAVAPSVAGCLALVEGDRTITATVTGSSASDSIDVSVPTLSTITLDSPLDGASFGPRASIDDTCATGNPGEYGVPVTATVDQATDRRVDFLVNNAVVASNVPIVGVTASACVAVAPNADNTPAGASTITARLTQTVSNQTVTDSAAVDVTTVAITDPGEGDAVTTNCAQLPGRGYTVVVDIDPMHEGETYTFSAGTGDVTGTVSSNGSAVGCVPLAVGAATISASLSDSADGDSVDVTVPALVDPPSVMLAMPSNGQVFGPRASVAESCDTGVAGEYGVPVMATIDTITNREVSILVNDVEVVAPSAPSSTTINDCVAVPDDDNHSGGGPSTVTVVARSTVSNELGEGVALVDVNTVVITTPSENDVLSDADDCDAGPGTGVQVSADVDVIHNGVGFELASNGHTVTGSVMNSLASGCLALDAGMQTITATIGGGPIADSVHVIGGFSPTTPIVLDALPAPDPNDAGYRAAPVTATWPEPTQTYAGQLVGYELRCDESPLDSGASLVVKDGWWNAAQAVVLPPGLTPDDANPSADLDLRIGDIRHCVLRAYDSANQYTPIDHSTELTKLFRQLALSTPATNSFVGSAVAALGDIDGDGIADMLAGGYGRAELFFGTGDGFAGTPDVVFTTTSVSVGLSVVGLGDFNGDGVNDFAMADPEWPTPSYTGRVNVYFGRPKAAWPTDPIALEGGCNADLCLEDDLVAEGSGIGLSLSSVGDFDGDDANDIAFGSGYAPGTAGDGKLFIVKGDNYESHSCGSDLDCRAIEHCDVDTCALDGGETFWGLEYEVPSATLQNPAMGGPVVELAGFELDATAASGGFLGWAMAPLGDFDGFLGAPAHARTDIAITTYGPGEVHFLSGRPHSGGPGIDLLTPSDLGLRDTVSGIPDGLPIASSPGTFGYAIGVLGDFYHPPTGTDPGAFDLVVSPEITDDIFVLGGERTAVDDPGFGTAAVHITYQGTNIGQYLANSWHPTLGVLGDLDGDGEPELCAGSRMGHAINVLYADQIAAAAALGDVALSDGIDIEGAIASPGDLAPQFVGDVNDDGYSDIAVGESYFNTDDGRVVLLY